MTPSQALIILEEVLLDPSNVMADELFTIAELNADTYSGHAPDWTPPFGIPRRLRIVPTGGDVA